MDEVTDNINQENNSLGIEDEVRENNYLGTEDEVTHNMDQDIDNSPLVGEDEVLKEEVVLMAIEVDKEVRQLLFKQ